MTATTTPTPISAQLLASKGIERDDMMTLVREGEPVAEMLFHALRQADNAEANLRAAIASAAAAMDEAIRSLDGGYSVNEIGILQQRGANVDRYAALYGAAREATTMALHYYTRFWTVRMDRIPD